MRSKFSQLEDGTVFDASTGEIYDRSQYVAMIVPRKQKIKENWFMGFQDAFEALAIDKELRGEPRAVLDFLISRLDFENYILVQQVEIARKLEIDESNVSRAIKKLVDKQVILRGPKAGKTPSYKLNAYYGWKGTVKNFKEEKLRLRMVDKEV
jgi:hypothetical protein